MAKKFAGTSTRGDITEALQNAIVSAKTSLRSDLITWRLDEVTGEDGGFVHKSEIRVFISAQIPKDDPKRPSFINEGTMLPGPASEVYSTIESMLSRHVSARKAESIEEVAQSLLAPKLGTLPPVQRKELHYIRALSGDRVVYQPEFIYLFDYGYPAIAGIVIPFDTEGTGDPTFPDPKKAEVRSVLGWTPARIIFPVVAGNLLVATKSGTMEEEVKKALKPYGEEISYLYSDTYKMRVKLFHEPELIQQIEKNVELVRYVEPDGILRLIDISPGWVSDRVM